MCFYNKFISENSGLKIVRVFFLWRSMFICLMMNGGRDELETVVHQILSSSSSSSFITQIIDKLYCALCTHTESGSHCIVVFSHPHLVADCRILSLLSVFVSEFYSESSDVWFLSFGIHLSTVHLVSKFPQRQRDCITAQSASSWLGTAAATETAKEKQQW